MFYSFPPYQWRVDLDLNGIGVSTIQLSDSKLMDFALILAVFYYFYTPPFFIHLSDLKTIDSTQILSFLIHLTFSHFPSLSILPHIVRGWNWYKRLLRYPENYTLNSNLNCFWYLIFRVLSPHDDRRWA